MNKIKEKDWKLFQKKIVIWQEKYIGKLNQSYIELLSQDKNSNSEKLSDLLKKINKDLKNPVMQVEKNKDKVIFFIVEFLVQNVINMEEISGFSKELQETVKTLYEIKTTDRYFKLRVTCKDCPTRLNRVLLVRKDLNLKEVGFLILTAFDVEFEHMYLFKDKNRYYEDKLWVEDTIIPNAVDYETVTLEDVELNSQGSFTLEYDTGEGWEFNVKVYEKRVDYEDEENPPAVCLKGKGDRIFEDNRFIFIKFIETGKIDASDGYPWDIDDNYTMEDFDKELDLKYINDSLKDALFIMERMDELIEY